MSHATDVLAQRPYRPSNGCEGLDFKEVFCFRCRHYGDPEDANNPPCRIELNASLYMPSDPEYPKEWVQDAPFGNPRCTAFAEVEP